MMSCRCHKFALPGIVLMLFCSAVAGVSLAGEPQGDIPLPIFEFAPVVEGVPVVHQFAVFNRGDAPLEIIDIKWGCGCTAASSTRQIPPAGEGYIEVTVDTNGYGGSLFREKVRVQTNDPKWPWLELVISGKVEKFAEVRPERLNLSGPAGEPLVAQVEIIPRPEQPFTVGRIQAQVGTAIRFAMVQHCRDGHDRCIIQVENTRDVPGRYADLLLVETDNPIKPAIPIPVVGMIR